MFDHHLYVMDTRTGKVTPVTADDKTSISDAEYSPADGNVYYTAENGDSVSLYRLSLKTFRFGSSPGRLPSKAPRTMVTSGLTL